MDNENKLNIEKWSLNLNDKIKYMLSLDSNFTFILTKNYFCVYEQSTVTLSKFTIPHAVREDILVTKFDQSLIWSDANGNHVIFKLDKITYYYNNSLPENQKIKALNLEVNGNYIEPYSFAFNNNNVNPKLTDDIIFSDKDSSIYILNINVEQNGEIQEKINKVFDFKNNNIDSIKSNEENKENKENKEKEEKLNELLDDNYFSIEKDDRIYDMKLYVNEEKITEGKKVIVNKSYFLLAISKRIIFQFAGKNSIKEIFSKYNTENNLINKDELLKDCKIFPAMPKIGLEKPRIQIFKSNNSTPSYYWNNDCGFCTWELIGKPLPLSQKEFKIYNYIKLKNDATYEKNPCPTMCCRTQKCIYFLYKDSLVVLNTLTNNIIQVEYFKEEFLDIYYNEEMDKLILYSNDSIIKISLTHENNYLWKDYIERGEYNLAIQNFSLEDKDILAKLHKLNADLLFNRKDYELSGLEYALSDENFEHICLKFLKLNDIKPLINYLNCINHLRLTNSKENDDKESQNTEEFFIQKYLINTWLFELLLESENIKENEKLKLNEKKSKDDKPKNLKEILFESRILESHNLLDKRIIYKVLKNYGRRDDFISFAGIKNDYRTIIFNLVNENKYKEAVNNLILYMSYSDNESFLKNLMNIFFTYSNIFIQESPKEVIQLLNKYYYLVENPSEIIRIITNIDIYNTEVFKEFFDDVLILIKKLINLSKKGGNNKDKHIKDKYDFSIKQNLYNLYILYLSLSNKSEHYTELLNYLKSLVNNMIKSNNYFGSSIDNTIYFDYSFVINILKKSKSALALIYCLKKEYNRSISYSLSNEDKDTSIFIASAISDPKKKKEIWLLIFNHFKSNPDINVMQDVLNKSQGVLKILDILPHLMGNVQFKNIKNDINSCINSYESKLKALRLNIKDYCFSAEIITQKLNKLSNDKQRPLTLNMEEINCTVCLKNLKETNFYLFPCRHVYDFNCLLNLLFYYESRKIGDKNFKKKMENIKQVITGINLLNTRKKSVYEKKSSLVQKEKKNIVAGFLKTLTFRETKSNINFSNEEEKQLVNLENLLDDLLSQECPLCGDEMILSTQTKFGDEENADWLI